MRLSNTPERIAHGVRQLDEAHPIIGLVVICSLFLQPPLGLLHHQAWKKQSKPTVWSRAHLWWGRIMLILGGINGGLGLQLSGDGGPPQTAYIVLAAIFYPTWFVVAGLAWVRCRNMPRIYETGEKIARPKQVAVVQEKA